MIENPQNEAEARARRHSRGVVRFRTSPNSANKDVNHRPPSRNAWEKKKMGVAGVTARFALPTSIELTSLYIMQV